MITRRLRQTALYVALIAAALTWDLMLKRSESNQAASFEVASWNMRWFPSGYQDPQTPKDEARRLSQTARLMRKQGVPDILFAQEIRDLATCQALAGLLNDTAFRPVVCSAFIDYETQKPTRLQLAIFSRYQPLVAGYEPWHTSDFVYPPRGYAYAVFDIGGELIACFTVHLKSNYIPEGQNTEQQTTLNRLKRELSSRQILDRIEAFRREGVKGRNVTRFIIAGDFNASLFDERYQSETTLRSFMEAGFSNAHDGLEGEAYATMPGNKYYPATTFDYIFYRGLTSVGKPQVLPPIWISDHREIRAVFTLGGDEALPLR